MRTTIRHPYLFLLVNRQKVDASKRLLTFLTTLTLVLIPLVLTVRLVIVIRLVIAARILTPLLTIRLRVEIPRLETTKVIEMKNTPNNRPTTKLPDPDETQPPKVDQVRRMSILLRTMPRLGAIPTVAIM